MKQIFTYPSEIKTAVKTVSLSLRAVVVEKEFCFSIYFWWERAFFCCVERLEFLVR